MDKNKEGRDCIMLVLGLQGSPRTRGNTNMLLSAFLKEAENLGAGTLHVQVPRKNISPCVGCGNCEREGFCPNDDDMQEIYSLLRQADIIAMATPVYFYGPTAQMKALIDRAQTLWARKYVHKLTDPGRKHRRGLLLSVGATKGNNLFDGMNLTTNYFFDAVGASFDDSLTYREIEKSGEIKQHPSAFADARKTARLLVNPLLERKRVLFICTENACRSQMASAFAQQIAGDKLEVNSAGSAPAKKVNPLMEEVMMEKGMDMAFRKPKTIEDEAHFRTPHLIVSMGCEETCPNFPGICQEVWNLPDPAGKSIEFMRQARDDIEKKVSDLVKREIG